ncbi:MAG TPA: tetratricopeptide repeat protein [Bacteroidetes bacterium]|nr:tetratricopeptide repeat protein [Bacteroidota bacterium]
MRQRMASCPKGVPYGTGLLYAPRLRGKGKNLGWVLCIAPSSWNAQDVRVFFTFATLPAFGSVSQKAGRYIFHFYKMSKRKKPVSKKTAQAVALPDTNFIRRYSWIIFAFGVLLYLNTLRHNYAVDDAIVIYDNEFTTKGVAGIPDLLKYDSFRGFFKVEGKASLVSGGRYRPLSSVMYALEVQLFSKKKKDKKGQIIKDKDGDEIFDPYEEGKLNAVKFVGHLINVLLYGLTGVVLFWLLLEMLAPGKKKLNWNNKAGFVALAATLVFMAHPVHTEVVANVKGRDEILSLLGSLAALYFSLKSFHEKKPALNILAAILFFLALFSKENAITFLAVIPLAYYFFTKADVGKTVLNIIPFFLLASIFLYIRGSILGWDITGEAPRELMNNPFLKLVGNQYVDFSFSEKMATIFYTLGAYIKLLFVPYPLSHDYYPRAVGMMNFGDWQVVLSILVYVAMGVYALIGLPKKDPVSFGILFYLGTLFLVSNIPFPIGTNMSERFLYMPSVGFALVAAFLFYKIISKKGFNKNKAKGGLAIIAIFSILTIIRNNAWKDNYTLFLTDIKTVPNSAKLRNAVGGELIAQALKPEYAADKNKMLNEAVGHLKEAIKIHPGYKGPLLLLGNAYNYLKNFEASVQAYEQALILDPNYEEAKNNLGITCRDAGRYYGEQKGDLNKALFYLTKAYEARPDDYEVLRLLGVAHGLSGQPQKAVEYFTKALKIAPDDAMALYNLGSAYHNAGQAELGNRYIQQALAINPNIAQERGRGK